MTTDPVLCRFNHSAFAVLEAGVFRLTEGDRVPALAVRHDQTETLLPLDALGKLFEITPDSEDGRLLSLIGQALRFVPALRMGDALPTEVLTGEASWQPSAYHHQVASARLQLQLLNWLGGGGEDQRITSQMLVVSVDDPSIRPRVQQALREAAAELGITGGGPAVAGFIEELATEIAFIEALRERLLSRVQMIVRRLQRQLAEAGLLAAARRETLLQVVRLTTIGLDQITARFDQADAATGDIMSALRNLERQRTFLRPHRDWLYSTQNAWNLLLQDWEALGGNAPEEKLWRLIDKLYRFVAPRYMTVQEWHVASANAAAADRRKAVVW